MPSRCKVYTVALHTHARLGAAGKKRTNLCGLNACIDNHLRIVGSNHLISAEDFLTVNNYGLCKISACESLFKRFDYTATIGNIGYFETVVTAAASILNNNFLRYIDKSSCEVTGVSGTKCRIRKTFTRTTRRNEVFKYIKTFTVVGTNRNLNSLTCGICNKTAHTCKLPQLAVTTTGARINHHINRVRLLGVFKLEVFAKRSGNLLCAFFPNLDNFV